MRRPPDVGKAALCIGLMLSISGCAGFSQHTTGSSPWTTGSEGENTSPPGLFSWWHRGGVQSSTPPTNPAGMQETVGRSQGRSEAGETATSPWPETQSEWAARTFPRFNRFWNGSPEVTRPASPDTEGVNWTNRLPEQSVADESAVAASAPRSDGAIRPTDGASLPAAERGAGGAGSRPRYLDELPLSPTPPPVRSPRESGAEPAGPEASAPTQFPLSSTDFSASSDGAQRVSFEPQNGSAAVKPTAGAAGSGSAGDQAASSLPQLSDILPAPALAGPQESATTALDSSRVTKPGSGVPAGGGPAAVAEPPASLDTRVAQVPPAPPPPTQRTPQAPSPAGDANAAASPPAPPASPAATPAGTEKAAGTTTPTLPAPATAASQAPTGGWGQRSLAASGQSIYASPPPMAPAQPRHHFMSWLFHDDDDATVLASAQGRLAAAPKACSSPQNVLPTAQGNAACDADCKAPKKPCFLKVWIHDWKNGHGIGGDDCGHGGVCASGQTNAAACDSGATAPKKPCFLKVWIHDLKNGHGSANDDCTAGAVYPSAQSNATACETPAKAPKKPCFLKVWIHDLKNGHGSGCGGCQNGGGSCCQNGKCCGGGMPVTGSAQGGIASGQTGAVR